MSFEEAIIDFLLTCPVIGNNPVFFNFLKAKDQNKQIITIANNTNLNKSYIDGSQLKRYSFTIIDYRSVTYQALVNQAGYPNENVEEYLDIQGLIDWIDEQNEARNYPDFGEFCEVDRMFTTSTNPDLNGVDTSLTPALAKYSVTVQIDYLDTSKVLWK